MILMKTNQFDIESVKEKLNPQKTPATYYIIKEIDPEDEFTGYYYFACIYGTFDDKTKGFQLIWNLSTFMTHQNLWKCLIFTEHSKAEEFCNILQSIKPASKYIPIELSFHPAQDELVQIPVYVKELNQVIIGWTFVSRLYNLPDPELNTAAWLKALNEKSPDSEQSFIDDLDESYPAVKNPAIPRFKTIDLNHKKLYTLVINEGYYDEIIYIYRYDYGSKAFEIDIVGRDAEIPNIFFTFNEAHAAAEALRKQDKRLKVAISPLKNFIGKLLEEKFVEVPCVIDYLNGKEMFTGYMPLNSLNEILPAQIKQFISDYPLVIDYSDEETISIDDLDEE